MAWFVSRRNCPSFLTANTVAGPLDRAPRSGCADRNHQDPPEAVLLYRRTAHPLGAPPHPASSPALALGKPVQSRPGSIASDSTPSLTAGLQLTQRPPNSRQLGPRGSLVACRPGNLAQRRHCGPPSSCLRGYLTQSSSPSIGIRPGSFAFLYPSALVSTPAPLPSVDPG